MDEFIENEHFILRKPTTKDAAFFYKLMNEKGWIENIGDRNLQSIKDAEKYIKTKYLEQFQKYGYGSYVVILKELNTPIGSSGLIKRPYFDYPDLGYAFLEEFHGRGYAFEVAKLILESAKSKGFKTIYAFTSLPNTISQNLLLKLGFEDEGELFIEDLNENVHKFSMDLK